MKPPESVSSRLPKICLHEAAATARVVFLVAERAAFKPEREAWREAIARPRQAPILLKRGSVGRIDGEEPQRRKVEPAFRRELETDRTALHRILRIARRDALIFGFDACEQF